MALATCLTTSAFGLGLELIPTLSGDTINEPRAITSDGKYVVGLSGTRGFLYPVGSGNSINVLSSDGMQSSVANGVGYRTSGGNTELIISGTSTVVAEWMTTDGGTTFNVARRDAAWTRNTRGTYNQLGATTGSDAYYTFTANSNLRQLDINRFNGPWPATHVFSRQPTIQPDTVTMRGVGASGRAVGERNIGGTSSAARNYMMDFNGTGIPIQTYFNGLNTVTPQQGQGMDVSDDGVYAVGWSGLGTDTANSYAYKAKFSGTTQLSVDMLPVTGLEVGSTAKTTPYGISADGRYAVGRSYQNGERAILWDTGDANPANWTYLDLTQYATENGLLDGFTSLQRGVSVGVDPESGNPVVTGFGLWSGDGGASTQTRGWVLTVIPIPEPTTAALAGLAAAVALIFRRRN